MKKITREISMRDSIDSSRKDSPLVVPEGAAVIDTSSLSIKETYERIKGLFYEKVCNGS
jgi:cytidylate kinase